ncbi:MAG: phosphopantothenoylcysteine decarboxylase [Candidatus Omnitrophica bacterium]|nr:phosphopantothenoylcysteine decarboxylase [Candidatus Omnitrophota bacterium]
MKQSVYRLSRTIYLKRRLHLLITAGPTREPIDPVRFISNYSTGVLGYTLAKEAKKKGYKVTLISGITDLNPPPGVKFVLVNTASEMYKEVKKFFPSCNCLIMTAGVCDFQPVKVKREKIKKESLGNLVLRLKRTPDILYEMGKRKGRRTLIGFALETDNLLKNAKEKLRKKNLDLLVAQRLEKNKTPFGNTEVSVILIHKDGSFQKIPPCSKSRLAKIILGKIKFL